jgi:hypothetical protein
VVGLLRRPSPDLATARRYELAVPADHTLTRDAYGANVALSPDGSNVVYNVMRDGKAMLVIQRLDRGELQPIPGSETASLTIFAPDGKYIAFNTFKDLKKVDTAGGPSTVICGVDAYFSGETWGADDSIVFT